MQLQILVEAEVVALILPLPLDHQPEVLVVLAL
jgi:hypothetical protein